MYGYYNKIAFLSIHECHLSLPNCLRFLFFSFERERERGGMNGRKPLVIAPAEPTFKDCLCILETCSILKSLLLPSFVDDTSI